MRRRDDEGRTSRADLKCAVSVVPSDLWEATKVLAITRSTVPVQKSGSIWTLVPPVGLEPTPCEILGP